MILRCLPSVAQRCAVALLITLGAVAILGAVPAPVAAAGFELRLHIRGAGTVTEVTSAKRMNCTSPATTPTGVEGALCPVGYDWGWVVELAATPAPGYTFAGWQGVADPKAVKCDGSNANLFLGSGNCRFQFWESLGLEARFVDTEAPDTIISEEFGPSGIVSSTNPWFHFRSTQAGSTFQCQLDSDPYSACTVPKGYGGLADGPHTFRVYAIDPSGHRDPSPASRSWTVDTKSPTITITERPPELTSSTSANFAFTVTDEAGVSRVECKLDSGPFASGCRAGFFTDLADGHHVFIVAATDAVGNQGQVEWRWTIDSVPPSGSVTINGGAALTRSRNVTLGLAAADPNPGSGVRQMRFSNGNEFWSEWVPFASSMNWTLSAEDGAKTVTAEFRDAAGNVRRVSDEIHLDTTRPKGRIAINRGAAFTRNPAVTLALTASDPDPGTGVVQMRLRHAGGTWSDWQALVASTPWTLPTGDGPKAVEVQFKDATGNLSAIMRDAITLDTVKPSGTVKIDQGATTTASRTVTLTLSATDPTPGSGVATMRIRNAGGTWSAWQPVGTSAPWTLTDGAGSKRVDVQYRDKAGNVSAVASDSITFQP